MSGITFGSVGDIIAVTQICISLAQALSDSRGSASAYQALVKELRTFDKALLQVGSNGHPRIDQLLTGSGCSVMAELRRQS